jgi:hypothetical protein
MFVIFDHHLASVDFLSEIFDKTHVVRSYCDLGLVLLEQLRIFIMNFLFLNLKFFRIDFVKLSLHFQFI